MENKVTLSFGEVSMVAADMNPIIDEIDFSPKKKNLIVRLKDLFLLNNFKQGQKR